MHEAALKFLVDPYTVFFMLYSLNGWHQKFFAMNLQMRSMLFSLKFTLNPVIQVFVFIP